MYYIRNTIMKNLSFKEWFKLKEVDIVGAADAELSGEIKKAMIDAETEGKNLNPNQLGTEVLSRLAKNPKIKKTQDAILRDKTAMAVTAAAKEAATKKPATTGANPAAKTI